MRGLRDRLTTLFERRKKLEIAEIQKSGDPQDHSQLPVYYGLIRTIILNTEDWSDVGKLDDMIRVITEVAEACGLYLLEKDNIGWDLPLKERNRHVRKPIEPSIMESKFRPPTVITDHIPKATKGGRHANSDGMWDDPTYNVDDA